MAVSTQADTLTVRSARRARSVWLVLFGSSLAFLLLCGLGSFGVFGYLGNITTPHVAKLALRHGDGLTVKRQFSEVYESVLPGEDTEVREGDETRTGLDTEAFLELFDDNTTIQTYFSTVLKIDALRTTRFFEAAREARLTLRSGTALVVTGELGEYGAANYTISTERAEVSIKSGSKVRVRVDGAEGERKVTYAIVDYGSAMLISGGKRVDITSGMMAWGDGREPPTGPVVAEEELVHNGTFTESPTRGADLVENGGLNTAAWVPVRESFGDSGVDQGSVNVVSETVGSTVVYFAEFARAVDDERYAKAGVRQEINQPVDFFREVELGLTVKVLRQSLPLGGPQGDVYPLTIRVSYDDSEGTAKEWKRVFYYVDGAPNPGDASQVEFGSWAQKSFTIKSPEEGRDIAVINSIEIYGYGTQYQSWVTGISMKAR